jgi:hypothetical protein
MKINLHLQIIFLFNAIAKQQKRMVEGTTQEADSSGSGIFLNLLARPDKLRTHTLVASWRLFYLAVAKV